DLRRFMLAIGSPVQADDTVVFNENVIAGKAGELAAREADDDQAPLESNAPGAALAGLAAYRVIDHVCAAPCGYAFDHLAEISGLVIDDDICAVVTNHREFVIRTGGADDLACAEGTSNLHGGQADAAGG